MNEESELERVTRNENNRIPLTERIKSRVEYAGGYRVLLASALLYASLAVGTAFGLRGCINFGLHQFDELGKKYAPKVLKSVGDINKDGFEDFAVLADEKEYTSDDKEYLFLGQGNGKYILDDKSD
ncbi:hypothetical protein GOV06_05860 [Candidatus Woesearchaeota archaeon]|nr:hypothetical protein [Candidatus Woesearchaeota archaeon]